MPAQNVTVTPASAGSQSLERGLAILSAFRPDQPLLGISELARMLELNRSTTHRYVSTLCRLGYLQQDASTRRYRLGPRVLDLGFSAINSMELREIAAPQMQELSDETGHTVNLAILDHADIVYIERVRSSQPGQRHIDLNLHAGARLPAYCTSMGKVLLANLPDGRREALLDEVQLVQRGPNTLIDRAALTRGAGTRAAVRPGREQRGAGVRAALDRGSSARSRPAMWSPRSTWPCTGQ